MKNIYWFLFLFSWALYAGGGQTKEVKPLEEDDFENIKSSDDVMNSFMSVDLSPFSMIQNKKSEKLKIDLDELSTHIFNFFKKEDLDHKVVTITRTKDFKESIEVFLQGSYLNTGNCLLVKSGDSSSLMANMSARTSAFLKDARDVVKIHTDLFGVPQELLQEKPSGFKSEIDEREDFCAKLLQLGVLALKKKKENLESLTIVTKGTGSLSFETHIPCSLYFETNNQMKLQDSGSLYEQ